MAKAGRKSYLEEVNIAQRYTDLTEPAFKVLRSMLNSDDKSDQKWAVEQLTKAFVKMIPQDITSGGKQLPQPILNVHTNDSYQEDTGSKEEN